MNRKPEAENEEEDLEVEEVDSDEWDEDDEDLVIDVLIGRTIPNPGTACFSFALIKFLS